MNFLKIGDKVSVIDDTIEGEIIAFENEKICIKDKDGFNWKFSKQKVVLKSTMLDKIEIDSIPWKDEDLKKEKIRDQRLKDYVIDLHIENIISSTNGMHNAEIIEIQLRYCKSKLESAIRNGVKKIIIVHGVGKGVLREEVRILLKQYMVEFLDASYQEYGFGATQVNVI